MPGIWEDDIWEQGIWLYWYEYHDSGSDEKPQICFVDQTTAGYYYGIKQVAGGPCPVCHFPVRQACDFNPLDRHYYFTCPGCMRTFRWANIDGSLSDFKVVKSGKRTAFDENIDFPNHW